MRPAAALLLLALAGCDGATPARPVPAPDAGAKLEAAAARAGLIPTVGDPVGLYTNATDRICVVPGGGAFRLAAVIDYGGGQGCSAAGSAVVDGASLKVDMGGGCGFQARIDGDRIVFPVALPAACDRACTGRTTLEALTVGRLSGSVSEARAMRDPRGGLPCAS